MSRLCSVLLGAVCVAVAGCSTLSPDEHSAACGTIEWSEYGRNDGALGINPADREDFFAACTELGTLVDFDAYAAGRQEGLKSYCVAERGFELGKSGARYEGVCPPETEISFLQGYEQGRREQPVVRVDPRFGFGFGFGFRRFGGPLFFRSRGVSGRRRH